LSQPGDARDDFFEDRTLLRHGAGVGTVKKLRIKRQTRRAPEEPRDPAPALRNDKLCISAHADYCRDDFIFQRQQSIEMRAAEWESRLKPLRPWAPNFVANLAFEIFA
jgi:hypothetical protein